MNKLFNLIINKMKPKINNFKLRKISVKKGSVNVEYTLSLPEGNEVFHLEPKVKYDYLPHADLTNVLSKYKPMLATDFYFDLLKKDKIDEIMSKISVNQVTLSGKDKTKGVSISGSIRSLNNLPLVLNSENFKYNGTKYGFEDSLQELEDELVPEVFAFIFENKKGQLTIFSDEEMGKED